VGVRVYGPDNFDVVADTNLDTYNAAWVKRNPGSAGWTGVMSVRAATKDVRVNSALAATYDWTGQTLLGQKLVAKISASSGDYPGIWTRQDPTGPAYLVEWQATENTVQLYRVTFSGGVPTYTTIANFGAVANATNYLAAYVRVTGISPCHIEYGDATNGTSTFDDSNAARLQSGQPGLSLSPATALEGAIDGVEIYDEDKPTPAPLGRGLAIQQRAAA